MRSEKRIVLMLLVAAMAFTGAKAQSGSTGNDDFDSFRKSMYGGFEGFRRTILADYATFLDGVWHEYDTFRGVKRDPKPKPKAAPDVDVQKPTPKQEPVVTTPNVPEPQVQPEPTPEPQPTTPKPAPAPTPAPAPAPVPVKPAVEMVNIDLFGLGMQLPKVEVGVLSNLDGKSLSEMWKELANTKLGDEVLATIDAQRSTYRMGDWQTYQYAKRYASRLTTDPNTQILITHLLLVGLGFDSRLGVADNSHLIILIPFTHMVYARPYLMQGDNKFFIFAHESAGKVNRISTYDMVNADQSLRAMNLVMKQEPLLPQNDKTYSFQSSKIKISGTVNRNLIALMDGYPQMPVPGFAKSDFSNSTRRDVVAQVKSQVKGMSTLDAVNTILDFVQHAFEYATDDEQFGYEKPFFFEETLYYPYCDCEDRAVFYTYLLRNVLGMDAQLVHFPGHEAAVVALPNPIGGVAYRYNGKVYYISDPTYIGASTGMCMPDFENTAPDIEIF